MKRQFFPFVAAVVILLLSVVGCVNKPQSSSANTSVEGVSYDNSEYAISTIAVDVKGVGLAPDRQRAKDMSLNNAKRAAVDTLTYIVRQVAKKRKFSVKEPVEFVMPAMRNIGYTYLKGSKGAEFTCTAVVSLSAVTKDLYSCLNVPSEYGYYQFLRDVDSVMEKQ